MTGKFRDARIRTFLFSLTARFLDEKHHMLGSRMNPYFRSENRADVDDGKCISVPYFPRISFFFHLLDP